VGIVGSSFVFGCGFRDIAPGPYVVGPDGVTVRPSEHVTAEGPVLELHVALPERYACQRSRDVLFVRRPDGKLLTVSAAVLSSNGTRVALPQKGEVHSPCKGLLFRADLPTDDDRDVARVELSAGDSILVGALSWWSGRPQAFGP
jgi:hypothetical protein